MNRKRNTPDQQIAEFYLNCVSKNYNTTTSYIHRPRPPIDWQVDFGHSFICPKSLYPVFSHEIQVSHWAPPPPRPLPLPHIFFSICLHIMFLPRELLHILHNVLTFARWQVGTEKANSCFHFYWSLFNILCSPCFDCWRTSAHLLAISEVFVICQGLWPQGTSVSSFLILISRLFTTILSLHSYFYLFI